MNAYVFAGPTMPHDEIAAELGAICLPPASQGDIYRASLDEPWAIGLIDGYFERVPAVWHKEILWAMSRGIHVFGASSMGALRAAELATFGMIGAGEIFEAFRDGRLEDDDEVTVIHGDAETGYVNLSVAMVDIRATLRRAERATLLSPETGRALEQQMKAVHYPERSYPALIEQARRLLPAAEADAFESWLPAGRVHQKRLDALAMIRTMRDWHDRQVPAPPVQYHFEHTDVWDQVSRRSGRQLAAALPDELPHEWLLDELRLDAPRFASAQNGAFARALALDYADRQDVTVEVPLFRQTIDEFRREHGLLDAESLKAWLHEQELDPDTFGGLMQDDARVRWARTLFGPDIGRRLIDQLRISGDYGALAVRARDKARTLSGWGLDNPSIGDAPLGLDDLLTWFFTGRRGESVPASVDLYAVNHGYRDRDSFLQAVLREYYYTKQRI